MNPKHYSQEQCLLDFNLSGAPCACRNAGTLEALGAVTLCWAMSQDTHLGGWKVCRACHHQGHQRATQEQRNSEPGAKQWLLVSTARLTFRPSGNL